MADLAKFTPAPLMALPEPPKAPAQPVADARGNIPRSARSAYDVAVKQYEADRKTFEARLQQVTSQNLRIETANREGAERAERASRDQRAAAERDAAARSSEAESAAKRERSERNAQIAMSVGATLVGMAGGHAWAHSIKKSHAEHVKAIAKPTRALAKQAAPLIPAAAVAKQTPAAMAALDKLGGIVATAQRHKIFRVAGPVGMLPAGLLLAEGAFSRFVLAPQVESISKTGAEAARAVGTASLFAATSLVGARMLQNAMPTSINPASAAVATLEGAKNVVSRLTPTPAAAPGVASAVATAAKGMFKFVRSASPAALLVTAAAASVTSLMPSTPAQATPTPSPTPSGQVTGSAVDLARAAAIRTASDMQATDTAKAAGPTIAPAPMSDGRTDSYTRIQNGKTVRVNGYRTP